MKLFRTVFVFFVFVSLIFGGLYPLLTTFVAQTLFPEEASGSLILKDGRVIGSKLLGQKFIGEGYFHMRPSAVDYNSSLSGASNLAATSEVLQKKVQNRALALRQDGSLLPVDAVTESGSGLDPHITPAFAKIQIERVARARGMAEADVARLVGQYTLKPWFGFFGEYRVPVLSLNLALDGKAP